MDYGAALEMRFGATRRGFESRPLRHLARRLDARPCARPRPLALAVRDDRATCRDRPARDRPTFRFPDPELAGRRGVVDGLRGSASRRRAPVRHRVRLRQRRARRDATTREPRPIAEALADGRDRARTRSTAVANCHLHADHAGQNSAFPGVPIYVQAAEWEIAHTTDHTILEWIDFPGADYRPARRRPRAVSTAIRIVATPGHTPGHQSLVVETADGLVVLAGQAVLHGRRVGGRARRRSRAGRGAPDQDAVRPLDRSASATSSPTRVHFGHDRAVLDGVIRRADRPGYPSRAVLGGELAVPCTCNPLQQG